MYLTWYVLLRSCFQSTPSALSPRPHGHYHSTQQYQVFHLSGQYGVERCMFKILTGQQYTCSPLAMCWQKGWLTLPVQHRGAHCNDAERGPWDSYSGYGGVFA